MATYRATTDLHRAAPRVVLSDAAIDEADALVPDRQVHGVGRLPHRAGARRGIARSADEFYLTKRRRSVLIPHFSLPESGEGPMPFSFPPLGDMKEMLPGPLVLFVEVITKDKGVVTVESNPAAAVVHVALLDRGLAVRTQSRCVWREIEVSSPRPESRYGR